MNEESKQKLMEVIRKAVGAAVRGEQFSAPQTADPELLAHRGCFVTIKTDGRLRGCIGMFVSDKPLIELAVEMAYSSVLSDPRFAGDRVKPEELDRLEIEVSVLSELQKTDDPMSLELGKHGIYIKKGWQTGCFLPQVAQETGWDKEQFLTNCCMHKAGLPPKAWKEPDTDVYLFTAEVI